MVRSVMPEPETGRLGAGGAGHDLVAEADPEQRPAVVDDRAGEPDRALEPGRIAGTGRQDEAVDLVGQRDGRRDRVGQDPDPSSAPAHAAHDVRLQAEVDDPDERAALAVAADIHDRRRRDLADEVLVLPAGHGSGAIDGVVAVDEARLGDDCPKAAVGPEMSRESPGVDAGDRRDRSSRAGARRAAEHRRGLRLWRSRRRAPGATAGPTGRHRPSGRSCRSTGRSSPRSGRRRTGRCRPPGSRSARC